MEPLPPLMLNDDWTPGPPWVDWVFIVLGFAAFVGLTLAAYTGYR